MIILKFDCYIVCMCVFVLKEVKEEMISREVIEGDIDKILFFLNYLGK